MNMTRDEAIALARQAAAERFGRSRVVLADPEWAPEEWIIDAITTSHRLALENTLVINMAACDARKMVLRFDRLYRFHPVEGCASCADRAMEHDNAYGPTAQPRGGQLDLLL